MDSQNQESIPYSGWIASTINSEEYLTPEKLIIIFQTIDRDGDGNISKQELKECF